MIRQWVESALKGSGWTCEEVMTGVANGSFVLFTHPAGCMVAEFITSPRHKVMHVWAAGGTLEAIDALVPEVEEYAKRHGCDSGGATGRKGWLRYLRKHGYQPAGFAVEKEF